MIVEDRGFISMGFNEKEEGEEVFDNSQLEFKHL